MKDGGPAFPSRAEFDSEGHLSIPGMTLRQWYKGMALAGVMTGAAISEDADDALVREVMDKAAIRIGMMADAMLAEDEEASRE